MKVLKIYNNNIVAVMTEENEAALITGNGIGFDSKVGNKIILKPEYHFFKLTQPGKEDIQTLVDKLDPDAIEIARNIFSEASEKVDYHLMDSLLLHLADHISFKITMLSQGINVPNLLMSEIKLFYPKEFNVGLYGVSLINDKYGTELDEDEASYLALHILNSSIGGQSTDVYKITEFIKGMVDIVNESLRVENLLNQWEYERFITHLKFLGQRMVSNTNETKEVPFGEGFLQMRESDLIRINDILNKTNVLSRRIFGRKLTETEQIYLSIHVLRIKQNIGENYEKNME